MAIYAEVSEQTCRWRQKKKLLHCGERTDKEGRITEPKSLDHQSPTVLVVIEILPNHSP